MAIFQEIVQKIKGLSPTSRDLRRFGLIFFVILTLFGSLLSYRGRGAGPYFLAAALILGAVSLAWPRRLKPFFHTWMGLAIILGYFIPRFILILVFYLIITPYGLFLRLVGKDLLDLKKTDQESYWKIKPADEYDPGSSEKMY